MIVRFGVWITSQKRVYCLSNVIYYSIKMQRSKCQNTNPQKVETAGLADAQTRVSGLAKCPGFQSLFLRYIQCNFGLNPHIIQGDMKENVSGCFFSEHSVDSC